jgi:hypothetical protein
MIAQFRIGAPITPSVQGHGLNVILYINGESA